MKLARKAEFLIITALLLVYLGIFAYLNLFCYRQHVDSDIAAGSLLAREIWEQKTLTPDNWAGSTERPVVSVSTITAVFYAITGSMSLGTGITCMLLGAAFIVSMYLFLRWIGLRPGSVMLALLMISALPINGTENEDQIVPFFTLLFYLFADYYVMFLLLAVYSFWFYRFLKEKTEYTKKDYRLAIPFLISFCGTAILSAGGLHTFQIAVFPLFLYEIICLAIETDLFSKKIPKGRFVACLYTVTQMLAFGVSTLHGGQADFATYIESREKVISNIFIYVPSLLLKNFGFDGEVRVGSIDSIMHLLIIAFLILVGMALINIYGKSHSFTGANASALSLSKGRSRDALGFFICMFGVAAVSMALLTVAEYGYYFFAAWFVAVISVTIYYENLRDQNKGFADLIVFAVIVFAVLNLSYTYKDAVNCKDNLRSYEEVCEFMKKENLMYGYAEYWDANRLMLITDGEITMGSSYHIEDLGMYWWLTNTDWYPPTLPADMRTVYVVRKGKESGFLNQFDDPAIME